mmetsp:Transcript_54665/g.143972  ORF Transcript_54665/g.143972 Transcript_54665/m.143972 type:complete len:321 (+) Transcript_54665:62-1024(+)
MHRRRIRRRRIQAPGQLLQLVGDAALELLLPLPEALHQQDVLGLQVDGAGRAPQNHAPLDKHVDVELSDGGVPRDQPEEALRFLDVEPQNAQLRGQLPRLHLPAEMLHVQVAALAGVVSGACCPLQDVTQLLVLVDHRGVQVQSLRLFVWLRQLHGPLHKYCREDVEQRDLAEGHEEHKHAAVLGAHGPDGVHEHVPVFAPRGRLVERQYRQLHGAKLVLKQGVDTHFCLSLVVDQELCHALTEYQAEDVKDQRQHENAPEEREDRAHQGVQHQAQLGEELKHPKSAEDPRYLQDAQRAQEFDVHAAAAGVDGLHEDLVE